ncbi:hypothetical protein ACWGB8_10760 [Kitasatospora sp. NPDC054939]
MVCAVRPASGPTGRCFTCSGAYRSPAALGNAVNVLLALSALLGLAFVATDLYGVSAASAFADGDLEAKEGIETFTAIGEALTWTGYALLAATGTLFITWLYRVRTNADLFAPNDHQHGKG